MSVSYPARQTWTVVRVGLSLIFYGLLVFVISLLAYVVVQILRSGAGTDLRLIEIWILRGLQLMVWLALGGGFLSFVVGQILCCLAPGGSGVKPLAVISTFCQLLGLGGVGAAVGVILTTTATPSAELALLFWFGVGAGFLGHIFFLLFLRAVGSVFRDKDLASSSLFYVISGLIALVVLIGVNVLLLLFGVVGKDGGGIVFVVILVEALIGLFFLVYLVLLVGQARSIVAEAGARTSS
jgi:hypothetical protein